MIKKTPHHINMLLREFSKRKTTNPRYSMRAFAKFLGMSSATLSRILSNSQEISLTDCKKIIKKLKFSEHERLVFVRSVAEQKCQKTYLVLSTNLDADSFYPYEKNPLFVSNLDHKCIYLNDVAAKIRESSLDEKMSIVMANLGFTQEVVSFIEGCLEKVITKAEPLKHNLPIQTTVGNLVIESLFSPLLGKQGEVQAVASVLLNLNLEVVPSDCVS